MMMTGYPLDMQTTGDFASIFAADGVLQELAAPASDDVRVWEVMQAPVGLIDASASVMAAVDQLWLSKAECLVVMDENHPVGVISDRDLIIGCVCRHRRPTRTRVGEVMSTTSASCLTTQTVADALAVMNRCGASWIPVTDESGVVVGIVGPKNLKPASIRSSVAGPV